MILSNRQWPKQLISLLVLFCFLFPTVTLHADTPEEEAFKNFQCSFVDIEYDYEEGAFFIEFIGRVTSAPLGFPSSFFFPTDAMDRGTMYYFDAAGNRQLMFDIDYQNAIWRYWPGSPINTDVQYVGARQDGLDIYLKFKWDNIPQNLLGKAIDFQFYVDWDLDNNDNQRGDGGNCYYKIETETIDPVQNLQASSIDNNCNGIQLTWNNPNTRGISFTQLRHFVFRDGRNITPALSGLEGGNTTFTDDTAIPGVTHNYQIRSYLYTKSKTSHTVLSKSVSTRTYADPFNPVLTATEDGCSQQVKLSWTIQTKADLDKYVVERSTSSNFSNPQITELTTNSDQYLDFAQNGVQYYYRVTSYNPCGEKASSNVVSVRPNYTLDDITITDAFPISRGRIYVYWPWLGCYNPQETTLEKRNLQTGVVEKITLENLAVQYIDEDAQLCVNYRYKLIVKRQDNTVYISEPVEAYLEDDISDVLVDFDVSEGYYPDRVTLEWTANKENLIEAYKIYRRPYAESGSDFKLIANIKNGALNWVDQNVEANQYYEYKIMAISTCVEQELVSNELRAVGFRQPRGIISGQISYEGGTAVPDVKVVVNSSEPGPSQGTCIDLDGQSLIEADLIANTDFSQGFTIEGWVNMDNYRSFQEGFDQYSYFFLPSESFIFSYFEDGIFSDNPDDTRELWFIVGEGGQRRELIYDLLNDPKDLWNDDEWNHISYNYNRDSVSLFLNGEVAVRTSSVPLNNIVFDYTFGYDLDGKMDEIRVWNRSLSDEETARYYKTVTSGKEDGLILNWHLDEGFGDFVFDNSQNDNGFNGNHGKIVSSIEFDNTTFERLTGTNSTFSNDILPSELLSRHAFTDDVGSYFISGIPYRGEGEIYRVTPVFGQHSFDPPAKTRFIGDGEFVHNDVDFIDISSFLVTGRVTYRDTDFPVEDAFIKVDGKVVAGRDNLPIKTNSSGEFSISVPIGDHYVSVEKDGHVFNESVFPGVDSLNLPLLFDFQEPITGMQFYDDTKVKLAGRMVGGTLEGNKKIGFELSKNNIGPVKVRLVPVKPFSLNENTTENNFIEFSNDDETGEYAIYIIPEEFSVEAISHDNYTFDTPAFKAKVDLRKALDPITETDSVFQELFVNGELESRFDSVRTFDYNLRRDWIYRSEPSLSVTSKGEDWLSDEIFTYQKDDLTQEINLRTNDGGNLFQFPVFTQLRRYPWNIWVFEEYIHSQTNESSTVNVTDATITVANNLAEPNEPIMLGTNSEGRANYTFIGGFPNTSYDDNKPEYSFTLTANIVAKTSSGQVANWPGTNEVYRAYLMGSYPTGNNFVTTGPNKVDYVLRDPPGSASYATLEAGTTTSTTSTISVADGTEGTKVATVKAGLDVESEAGTPFFSIVTKVEAEANAGVTLEHSNIATDENAVTTSTTFTESFSTSASGDFVGAPGDVFIGRSTNIVYGLANNLGIVYPEDIPADGSRLDSEVNGLTIGIRKSVRINPSFNTFFVFSQKQIEENVIPNLQLLRNLLFVNQQERYQLIFNNFEDEKYGTNNDDPLWGNEAARPTNLYNGPSYQFIPFDYTAPDWTQDSVRFYNNQIKNWRNILADNERQKLRATPNPNHSNISFDAGSNYEGKVETSTDSTSTNTYEVTLNPGVATETGFALNGVGASMEITETFVHNKTRVDGVTKEFSQTIGFVLQDEDENNFLSVDVLDDKEGFGPIFRTKGGQTTCPYEGETKTKYYNRGTILDQATVRLENPVITADAAFVAGVPEDEAAIFKLSLRNATEVEVDRWFQLRLNSASNPDGAKFFIDGAPLSAFGLTVYIPAGKTVTKTLEVFKGAPTVNDYNDLELQFLPVCEVDDIVATAELGVSFVPACSKVIIDSPKDNWIANVYTRDTLEVRLTGFNVNLSSFKSISLQYKDQSSANWITLNTYYKRQQDFNNDNSDAKELVGARTQLNYKWILKDLVDRDYELRAITDCTDGSIYESNVSKGIKDTKRPRVFGTPQPSDGVLAAGDEVLIRFDEEIISGLLLANKQFVTAKGVLNGTELSNSTALEFNGTNNKAVVGDGIQMGNSSFTVETWVRRNSDQVGTFWSFGETADNQLKLSFNAAGKMVFSDGSQTYTGDLNYAANKWYHIALVYNAAGQQISAYQDDQLDLTTSSLITSFPVGRVGFGYDLAANSNYFNGRLRDFRIWNRALTFDLIFARKSAVLSGNEPGLQAYWLMDEKTGTIAQDKSHFRQAIVDANWVIEPSGQSIMLLPGNSYVRLDGRNIDIDDETDYTIEFWFNGQSTGNRTLFSSGRGTADETFNTNRSLAITASNLGVQVMSKGKVFLMADENLLDSKWHHLALVVKRGGTAKAFVDGKLTNETDVTGFGGLGSDFFYLGARGWRVSEGNYQFDQYYDGAFDEVRFWKSARTAEQISAYRNHRVPTDEVGLVGYYPFEKYERDQFNVLNLIYSIDDQWAGDGQALPGQTALVSGPVASFNETPNIGLERPVKQLNFDLVVNNDEVLVQIEEPLALIENTLLEFSIRDATDVHNNILASPVQWTAFVSKNQLKWETAAFDLEKEIGQELSFTASIRNFGGTAQNYFIDNLPPWLSVSPSSGSLNALTNTEVTFTINEALNEGDYTQDIYLMADNGVNERLTLSLNVFKPAPDWSLTPSDYEFSMNAIGLLRIEGELSRNEDDIVAVFQNGECRGRANLSYIPENDQYMVFLDIYGNQFDIGFPYEIKVWSDTKGEIITDIDLIDGDNIQNSIVFSPGQLLGRSKTPVIFSADNVLEKSLPLNNGWNWISFNLSSPDQAFVGDMFRTIEATSGDLVKSIDLFEEYNDFTGWFGAITAAGGFRNEAMYQLKLAKSDTLVYSGIPLNPAETPIQMKSGWNWIGYIPNFAMPVAEALANLQPNADDLIKGQRDFAIYDEGLGWIGSLKSMRPGAGYKYFSNAALDKQLIYPSRSLFTRSLPKEMDRSAEVLLEQSPTQYESNMNMVAMVTGLPSNQEEYWLLAKHEDEIVGSIQPQLVNGRPYYFASIYGQKEAHQLDFALYNPVTTETIVLAEKHSYQSDQILGNLKEPVIFNIQESAAVPQKTPGFTVWPQPFDQTLAIDLELETRSDVQIELYNMQGQKLAQLYRAKLGEGTHRITFSAEEHPVLLGSAGAYTLKVMTNGRAESRILLKK